MDTPESKFLKRMPMPYHTKGAYHLYMLGHPLDTSASIAPLKSSTSSSYCIESDSPPVPSFIEDT